MIFLIENGINKINMEEIWTEINESEHYELSNFGNIRNKYNHVRKSLSKISSGYLRVSFSKNKVYLVHRLVAKYFLIKSINNYNIVNHKDENKLNNRVDNLEWCDYSYNNSYGKGNIKRAKSLSKCRIKQYNKKGELIAIWSSKEAAARIFGMGLKNKLIHKDSVIFNGYNFIKDI